MSDFKKIQVSFTFHLFLLSALLLGVHSYLFHYFAVNLTLFFPIWHIYIFLFLLTGILFSIINYKFSKGKKEVFSLFMGITLLKMILSILFLLPLILSEFENKQPDVFNFFIPYFIYLFFEVYMLTQLLKES